MRKKFALTLALVLMMGLAGCKGSVDHDEISAATSGYRVSRFYRGSEPYPSSNQKKRFSSSF